MPRFIPVVLSILAGVVYSSGTISAREPANETGFRFDDGLIRVDVCVPGRTAPLHFILDTGAGATVIDRTAASELGLQPGGSQRVLGTQGGAMARSAKGFRARIANCALPQEVLVLDLEFLSRSGGERVDGLLGADFLSERSVQIDFAMRRLRFGPACKPIGVGAIELPLIRRNGAWCVSARVEEGDSSAEWLRLDTGYDGALSWCPGNQALRDTAASSHADRAVGSNVQLGTHQVANVAVELLDRRLFQGEGGLLGNGVWSRYCMTLEPSADRLILEPAEHRL